jgi:hypothetical protein
MIARELRNARLYAGALDRQEARLAEGRVL